MFDRATFEAKKSDKTVKKWLDALRGSTPARVLRRYMLEKVSMLRDPMNTRKHVQEHNQLSTEYALIHDTWYMIYGRRMKHAGWIMFVQHWKFSYIRFKSFHILYHFAVFVLCICWRRPQFYGPITPFVRHQHHFSSFVIFVTKELFRFVMPWALIHRLEIWNVVHMYQYVLCMYTTKMINL